MIPVNINRLGNALRTWSGHPVASTIGGAALGYAAASGNPWAIAGMAAMGAAWSQERRKDRFIANLKNIAASKQPDADGKVVITHDEAMAAYHDAVGPSFGKRLLYALGIPVALIAIFNVMVRIFGG